MRGASPCRAAVPKSAFGIPIHGHKMLVIVYHLLWQGTCDEEQRYTDQRPNQEERDCKRAITALKRLGYDVTVKRVA
jgi:hypothetical protein